MCVCVDKNPGAYENIPGNKEVIAVKMPRLDGFFSVLEDNLNKVMEGESKDRGTQGWRP